MNFWLFAMSDLRWYFPAGIRSERLAICTSELRPGSGVDINPRRHSALLRNPAFRCAISPAIASPA
jgi:hypothetical protein